MASGLYFFEFYHILFPPPRSPAPIVRTIQSTPPLPFFYLRFVLGLSGRRPRCWLQQRGACRSSMASSHTQGIRGNLNTLNASKTTHPSQSTRSRHSSHHHPRHVQGIQGTQHIQGIQGTHDFVVLNRQQNVHGVWATATFRQKSSRRVDHSNISPLQDPAWRGQIL